MRVEAVVEGGIAGFLVGDGGAAGVDAFFGGPLGFFVPAGVSPGFFIRAGTLPPPPSDAFVDLSLCCPSFRGLAPLSVIVCSCVIAWRVTNRLGTKFLDGCLDLRRLEWHALDLT